MEKIVYGLNGKRIESVSVLQEFLEHYEDFIPERVINKIMNMVSKVMVESYKIGNEDGINGKPYQERESSYIVST